MARIPLPGSRIVVDSRNPFLAFYYNQSFNSQVPVPAAVVSTMFQLDFKRTVESFDKSMELDSAEKLEQLLKILVATYDSLSTDEVVKQLTELGFKMNKIDEEGETFGGDASTMRIFVERMRAKITQQVAESGIQNVMLRNVLNARLQAGSAKKLEDADMNYIADVVRVSQKFFAKFVEATPSADLVNMISESISANPILLGLKSLAGILRSETAGVVPCRESYALDQLFEMSFGTPFVTSEPLLTAKAYNVTGVGFPEVSYGESVAAFMWSMNMIMGLGDVNSGVQSIKLSDLVAQIVTGVGQTAPFLPIEAGSVDEKSLDKHFTRVFMTNCFLRLLRDQPGDYRNRIENMINTNKFFKFDEYQTEFKKSLYVLSIAFEAFRDTAAFYRELYTREDIRFKDDHTLHPLKRRQITKFLEENTLQASGFQLSMEHPNYYKQAGHLISHTSTFLTATSMSFDYIMSKKERQRTQSYVLATGGGLNEERFLKVFTGGLVAGSWYDINDGQLPFSIRMMNMAKEIVPLYTFTLNVENPLLTTKIVQHLYSMYSLSKIQEIQQNYPEIGDALYAAGQIVQFQDAEELSMVMQIPLEVAQVIWARKNGSDFFLDISGHKGIMFFIDPALSAVYEYRELSQDRYVPPFIANYPAIDSEETTAFNAISTPTFIIPVVTKGKKKSEKKKPDTADDNDDDEGETAEGDDSTK